MSFTTFNLLYFLILLNSRSSFSPQKRGCFTYTYKFKLSCLGLICLLRMWIFVSSFMCKVTWCQSPVTLWTVNGWGKQGNWKLLLRKIYWTIHINKFKEVWQIVLSLLFSSMNLIENEIRVRNCQVWRCESLLQGEINYKSLILCYDVHKQIKV